MSEYFELPTRNDGGPAFPRPQAETSIGGCMEQDGMSLRDYFAGQAMAKLIALAVDDQHFSNDERGMEACALIAEASYKMADAMLAERSKP